MTPVLPLIAVESWAGRGAGLKWFDRYAQDELFAHGLALLEK
jgi:hypothetical protein